MPFDESLAVRVRQCLPRRKVFHERRMFGGIGFLLDGNLCVAIWRDSLIARVGPDAYEGALASEFVREFDITGRAMKGWVVIEPEGIEDDTELESWVRLAVQFVRRLPGK